MIAVEASDPITILMPCKHQRREFFLDAVRSVVQQTSPHWRLLIITDPSSPPEIDAWAASFGDKRIQLLSCPQTGFARALNYGLAAARTSFVSILLSDDRYTPPAVETLTHYRLQFPAADFFHSARCHINEHGELWGDVMPSRDTFDLSFFRTRGSPVKHLLCWRRETSLRIGGMDESLSPHGCDDYDFPWSMAEAGARFQAVHECLYEYRLHHSHDRLTTTVPLHSQVATLRTMFRKHAVPEQDADRYVQKSIQRYLVPEFLDQIDRHRGAQCFIRCFREAEPDAVTSFQAAGYKERHFFPHRVYVLPKGGPDGSKLCERMTGIRDPSRLREFVLYARPPVVSQFPREVYEDDDLQWHQQQFGISGQVACASVVVDGGTLRCYVLVSDLVQRVARVPEYRSRIDNRFKGWARLLVNAILAYAAENQLQTVYCAASSLILRNTDKRRNPKPPLFQRIYDAIPQELGAQLEGEWWAFDVKRLSDRIVALDRGVEVDCWPKIVCIMHDTERGIGHVQTDPDFAAQMDEECRPALNRMLDIERRVGVKATYNVVGLLYPELHETIKRNGHAISFHSYDHKAPDDLAGADGSEQLTQCRSVDYRVKGYRPVQSKLTPGLNDANLSQFNFEWLASSRFSFGDADDPFMINGIVKLPVHLDDYSMFRNGVSYEEWVSRALGLIASRDFVVIGLHDCYSRFWLDRYEEFLSSVKQKAELITLDEVAARVALGHARWFEAVE